MEAKDKTLIGDEAARLKALHDLEVLDTPFEEQFNEVVRIASHICGAPVALISLVDEGRQWFKAAIGINIRETSIDQSICAEAILEPDLTIIPDTLRDKRSQDKTAVTEDPNLRFYAGAPLITSAGLPIGMVCVLDYKPRNLNFEQGQMLKALARQVILMMEMKVATKEAHQNAELVTKALNQARSQNERLNLLFRINEHLIHGEAPSTILNTLFDDLARELDVDFYLNYLVTDDDANCLTLHSYCGISEEHKLLLKTKNKNTLVCETVARERNAVILNDIQAQDDLSLEALRDMGVQAYAVYPLMADGVLLGTLAFGSKTQKFFSTDTLNLMKTVSDQVSASMARINLVEKVKTRENDLHVLLEKAQSANIAKTEFLANMSHEIRTPMNAVIGLTHLLELSSPLSQKQRDFISTLKLSADALMALINDMLDIAKIESRAMELEAIAFDLADLVKEMMSIIDLRAKDKCLRFLLENRLPASASYIGDPTRIKQIILNLCSNAIKFTDKGDISIKLSSSRLSDDTDNVFIEVTDTGIGIAEDKLALVFQKFVQADASITRKYGGTGLGLAIIKTLTEIMGGDISVRSVLGSGSVFTARLPLKKKMGDVSKIFSDQNKHELKQLPDQKEFKILLVDDYPANIMVASMFLENFGYHYAVAKDGYEALQKLSTDTYHLILMDVQMHGIDGYETTKIIRDTERLQGQVRKYIIGMTAHALASDRDRCLLAGMDDYIAKPFNPDVFEAKLKDVMVTHAQELIYQVHQQAT